MLEGHAPRPGVRLYRPTDDRHNGAMDTIQDRKIPLFFPVQKNQATAPSRWLAMVGRDPPDTETMASRASSWQRYGPEWRRLRIKVFTVKGRRCWWCGGFATTVDHVIPRILGGKHELANLVPACRGCNYSRGAKTGNRLRRGRAQIAVPLRPGTPSRDW